jgi:hypothetical protein
MSRSKGAEIIGWDSARDVYVNTQLLWITDIYGLLPGRLLDHDGDAR